MSKGGELTARTNESKGYAGLHKPKETLTMTRTYAVEVSDIVSGDVFEDYGTDRATAEGRAMRLSLKMEEGLAYVVAFHGPERVGHRVFIARVIWNIDATGARECAAKTFAAHLESTNPNFNRAKFLKACRVGS